MRTRSRIAAVLCAAAFAVAAVAATYTWTGDVNSDWGNSGNWDAGGLEGYPASTADDAILPKEATTYYINLITVVIDDLTIYTSYHFTASNGIPELEVDSLTINAVQAEDPIVITISGATITTG